MRKYAILIFTLGIAICLIGAALMAFGEGLLGENHAGIATVIGIVGIGVIASSAGLIASSAKRSTEEAKP
jgi:hypothetical protein